MPGAGAVSARTAAAPRANRLPSAISCPSDDRLPSVCRQRSPVRLPSIGSPRLDSPSGKPQQSNPGLSDPRLLSVSSPRLSGPSEEPQQSEPRPFGAPSARHAKHAARQPHRPPPTLPVRAGTSVYRRPIGTRQKRRHRNGFSAGVFTASAGDSDGNRQPGGPTRPARCPGGGDGRTGSYWHLPPDAGTVCYLCYCTGY